MFFSQGRADAAGGAGEAEGPAGSGAVNKKPIPALGQPCECERVYVRAYT